MSFAEPDHVPESLRGLPGRHLVVPPDRGARSTRPAGHLDVGSVERLGSLVRLLDTAGRSLVIDHHASNTRFGQFHLVDAAAEATVVLVAAAARPARHADRPADRREPLRRAGHRHRPLPARRLRRAPAGRAAARRRRAAARTAAADHRLAPVRLARHAVAGAGRRPCWSRPRPAGTGWSTPSSTRRPRTACGRRSSIRSSTSCAPRRRRGVAAVLKQTDPTAWQVSLRSRAVGRRVPRPPRPGRRRARAGRRLHPPRRRPRAVARRDDRGAGRRACGRLNSRPEPASPASSARCQAATTPPRAALRRAAHRGRLRATRYAELDRTARPAS